MPTLPITAYRAVRAFFKTARSARRSKFAFAVVACIGWTVVFGQASAQNEATSRALELERSRIALERNGVLAQFTAQDAVCQKRFMVSNCVNEAKALRRERLDDLRRQEVAIGDSERKALAADAVTRVTNKHTESEQKAFADKAAAGQRATAERMDRRENTRQVTPRSPRKEAAGSASASAVKPDVNRVGDANPVKDKQRKVADPQKLTQAQAKAKMYADRKLDQEKRRLEKTGKPAAPLPIPP